MSQIRSSIYWSEAEKEITAQDMKIIKIFHTLPHLHPSQLGHIKQKMQNEKWSGE